MPSGNSIAASNLVRLSRFTGEMNYERLAGDLLEAFGAQVARAPMAHCGLLLAVDFMLGPSYEVVISGNRGAPDVAALVAALEATYVPNRVTVFRPADSPHAIERIAPYTAAQTPLADGRATAYVCRQFACELPTTDPGRCCACCRRRNDRTPGRSRPARTPCWGKGLTAPKDKSKVLPVLCESGHEAVASRKSFPNHHFPDGCRQRVALSRSHRALFIVLVCICPILRAAQLSYARPQLPTLEVGINEKLGERVPGELHFVNEHGDTVTLDQLVDRPTLISLVYYTCPSVCRPLLTEVTSMLGKLEKIDMQPNRDYRMITISFDPTDSPAGSARLKEEYYRALPTGFPRDAWTFLTADSAGGGADRRGWFRLQENREGLRAPDHAGRSLARPDHHAVSHRLRVPAPRHQDGAGGSARGPDRRHHRQVLQVLLQL
jgi:cytochrome oxidase Cu insertion factor (SCO1/SenC/PrrC family)